MEPRGTRDTTRRLLPYALFAALVCVFLWRPIFTGRALLPGDYLAQMSPWNTVSKAPAPPPQWNALQWDAIAQFYPWRVFYARSMRQGTIPLWNPYQFSGTPFLANGQSAVLYPLNLVFVVFSPTMAFTVYAALHLFLAAAFMYLLLRALGCREAGGIVGAICYAFCAFMVLWLELPTFIGAAVWTPLVLLLVHLAVERRSVLHGMLGGAALAMAFLAGHFQIAFYVALCACLWWLWKLIGVWRDEGQAYAFLKVVVPFVGFAIVAGLIAAPQVLPTVELAQNSHRVRDVTPEGYSRFIANAVQPYRLVTAFIPDFFGNPSKGDYFLGSAADYMEYGLYIGILPLVLALISLRNLFGQRYIGFFATLALIAILSAVGTPINQLFYYLIPGFSSLGGPNRILLLYFLGIAAMAGFGTNYALECWGSEAVWRGRTVRVVTPLVLGAFIAVWVLLTVACAVSDSFMRNITGNWTSPGCCPGFVLAFAAVWVIVVLQFMRTGFGKAVLPPLVICVVVADLFAFGINYNPTCERSVVYPDTELTTKIKQIAGDSRIAPINPHWSLSKTPDAILPPNAAMVYGLYDVQGYDSLFTRKYKNLTDMIEGEDSSPVENGNMVLVKHITRGLPGIARYALSREQFAGPEPRTKLVGRWCGTYVYEMLDAPTPRSQLPSPCFSFRFGLFLGCVGVGAIAGTGCYKAMRGRRHRR